MFVTKAKYLKLIEENKTLVEENKILERELREAKNLKEILTEIVSSQNNIKSDQLRILSDQGVLSARIIENTNIATLVDTYEGGQVLKHQANILLEINKAGECAKYFTAEPCDEGYNYKLIRK